MAEDRSLLSKSNRYIAVIAAVMFLLDQFTKWLVLHLLENGDEKIIVPGFFKFVHWNNTGAAWSMFSNNNTTLAFVALLAVVALFLTRHHFNSHTLSGQIAFGLIFGGIAGNLTDRLLPGRHAVIDFIYFYMQQRGGGEIGFGQRRESADFDLATRGGLNRLEQLIHAFGKGLHGFAGAAIGQQGVVMNGDRRGQLAQQVLGGARKLAGLTHAVGAGPVVKPGGR